MDLAHQPMLWHGLLGTGCTKANSRKSFEKIALKLELLL
jgi:hypothetical protein